MRTGTVTIDGDATPDAIIASDYCREIIVWSRSADTTGGYYGYSPYQASVPTLYEEGEKVFFKAGDGLMWRPGDTVGFMKTVSVGSFTFNKQEV